MNSSNKPRISVLLPVYNALPHLDTAVQSLLSQSYQNFKVLAFDDGSTDGSSEYLDSITDPRFSVVHQENCGLAKTLNRMLEMADTEFVARMDADDISLPLRFERQVSFMDQRRDVAVAGTAAGYVWRESSIAQIGWGKITKTFCYSPPMKNPPYWLPEEDGEILTHCSVMMRTEILKSIGGYPEIVPGQDLALWHRFSLAGHKLASLSEILVLFRITKNGISAMNLSKQQLSWRYISYRSKCIRANTEILAFEDYSRLHPMNDEEIKNLTSRAKIRNAVADLFAGNLFRGGGSLLILTILNPTAMIRKILRRIKR